MNAHIEDTFECYILQIRSSKTVFITILLLFCIIYYLLLLLCNGRVKLWGKQRYVLSTIYGLLAHLLNKHDGTR